MAGALQHVAFNCRDRIAQEKFYARHFGFRRLRVFNAGRPGEFVMIGAGPVRLELFQARNAVPEEQGDRDRVGFKHLCLEVDDVELKAAQLKDAGVDIDPVIDCSDQVPGLLVCFFRDPEGNVIELMQGWQDQADPPPLP